MPKFIKKKWISKTRPGGTYFDPNRYKRNAVK